MSPGVTLGAIDVLIPFPIAFTANTRNFKRAHLTSGPLGLCRLGE